MIFYGYLDGEKYGKPTSLDHVPSPVSIKKQKKDKIEDKIKYNPEIKAKTECDARSSVHGDNDPLKGTMSKAQRRRMRKKNIKKDDKELSDDQHKNDGQKDKEHPLIKAMKLDQIQRELEAKKNDDIEVKSNGKSEIEKMMEEDLNITFNETASLISSLSVQQKKHKKPEKYEPSLPSMDPHAQSLPEILSPHNASYVASHHVPTAKVDDARFGTLFKGSTGSIFGGDGKKENTEKQAVNAPLPPLTQNEPTKDVLPPSEPIKKTVNDAWNGEWLSPQNFKAVPKNTKNKKKKLKFSHIYIDIIYN